VTYEQIERGVQAELDAMVERGELIRWLDENDQWVCDLPPTDLKN
jgi:hypothetical protein